MKCPSCASPALDLAQLAAKLRRGAALMIGQGDYEAYAAHRRANHPDEPLMPREDYFLERQASRFGDGGRRAFRCC
jgi:uncharacterized short protein YbdD (DUF466 family)